MSSKTGREPRQLVLLNGNGSLFALLLFGALPGEARVVVQRAACLEVVSSKETVDVVDGMFWQIG
jgi:hypothetical protein